MAKGKKKSGNKKKGDDIANLYIKIKEAKDEIERLNSVLYKPQWVPPARGKHYLDAMFQHFCEGPVQDKARLSRIDGLEIKLERIEKSLNLLLDEVGLKAVTREEQPEITLVDTLKYPDSKSKEYKCGFNRSFFSPFVDPRK